MAKTWESSGWQFGLVKVVATGGAITLMGSFALALSGNHASAQIRPDATLGTERSVVTPNANVRGLPAELIEGGAQRGANLFHSFWEFNVRNGQRVYFANPAGIENILGRVTGNNVSKIFGTLGVDGGANLFLLNPNGIIFGQNAQLDIAGSFVGSTANSLVFANGYQFSATNPQGPPLLRVNLTPGLQYGTNQPSATITNAGRLAVGQDLTLAAGNLNLQGQLYAGGNLTLQAQDTVRVRDSVTNPFIAAAGGQLLVQGNQGVDIFALNHPESGLFSGGDMVVRSANTVGGDAHYTTGGSFRIEQLDGSLGNLLSPYDPIIRASGDVNFNTYTGTSLHILAGGSVTINSITITGTDATGNTINPTSTPTLANVTLSDGTPLVINGTAQPTLDIRAGTTAFGTPGITGNYPPPRPNTTAPATGANITIGNIAVNAPNGLVFLTNQYQPNTALIGGDIQLGFINASSNNGNGGSVFLDSRNNITISPGFISSRSGAGNAGNIVVIANNAISLSNDAYIASGTREGGRKAGSISITAGSLFIDSNSVIDTRSNGVGAAGNININVRDAVTIVGASTDAPSGIFSTVNDKALGNGGNINIQAGSLSIDGTAAIQANTYGQGNAGSIFVQVDDSVSFTNGGLISSNVGSGGNGNSGNIQINAAGSVNFSGVNPDQGYSSGLFTGTRRGTSGRAGNITVKTGDLRIADGAVVDASTYNSSSSGNIIIDSNTLELTGGGQLLAVTRNRGEGGNIALDVADGVTISGSDRTLARRLFRFGSDVVTNIDPASGIFTDAYVGSTGNSGNLSINTRQLNVTDGGLVFTGTSPKSAGDGGNLIISTEQLNVSDRGQITTASTGKGNAGDLAIKATGSMSVANPDSSVSTSAVGSTGNSGNLSINTGVLNVSDYGVVGTNSFGTGKAGNLAIAATDSMSVSNQGFVTTGSTGTGDSGDLSIRTGRLDISNGGIDGGLSTAALGQGNAGNLSVVATDSMNVVNHSNVITSSKEGVAGSLSIETGKLNIQDHSFVITDTFGAGDAGDLTVHAADSVEVVDSSRLSANTFGSGNGGDLTIETGKLSVLNAGEVLTVVTPNASGNAGTLTVRASDAIAVDGSKLATETYGSGNGGDLTLETRNLSVLNGGEVSTGVFPESRGQGGKLSVNASNSVELNGGSLVTATAGTGRAGDLTVNTRTFTAEGGGRVEAGTAGLNQGGTVTVNASESIELSGKSPSGITPTAISAFSRPPADVDSSLWTGNANSGGVNLTTKNLIIREGAQVTTAVEGRSQTGSAGDVQVQADSLDLTNGGSITSRSEGRGRAGDISVNLKDNLGSSGGIISATSTQAGGGNVNITANDIRLRNSSLVSTSVFDSTGGGGNININSEKFIALEDSDILANAVDGRGGDITIKSPAFLADLFSSGTAVAVGRNPGDFSPFRGNGRVDISAEATGSGTSGTVTLPTIDLTRGLTQLPSDLVDAERLIDRRCSPSGVAKRSSFTVTGRGGLPPSPNEPLRNEAVTTNWVTLESEGEKRDRPNSTANPTSTTPEQLVEAQGWVIAPNGQVILTAQAPSVTPQNPALSVPPCQGSQQATTR